MKIQQLLVDNKIEKIKPRLIDYGLTQTEATLYLTLLSTGPTTVMELSKHTKIKRATVQTNIETLKEKGFAVDIPKGTRRLVVAEPPEKLEYIVEMKRFEVEKLGNGISNLIKSIKERIPSLKDSSESSVKVYVGRDNVAKHYDDILASPKVRAYVNPQETLTNFPENAKKFKEAAVRGTRIFDLRLDSKLGREFLKKTKHKNYFIKFFQKKLVSMQWTILFILILFVL